MGQGEPLILLPGIIMPAAIRYAPLLEQLGNDVRAVVKDLEVYAGDTPPDKYSIDHEVDGISRAADEAGFERFHLYGHSGGGACSIAYVAAHGDRVLSLAVDEPAADFSDEGRAEMEVELLRLEEMPPEERMGGFVRMQLAPGVEPPPRPEGPPPEWMHLRPAGVEAFTAALQSYRIDEGALRAFRRPVITVTDPSATPRGSGCGTGSPRSSRTSPRRSTRGCITSTPRTRQSPSGQPMPSAASGLAPRVDRP
jgi:pimeloyl-ACP methyl ester carboxylesterase